MTFTTKAILFSVSIAVVGYILFPFLPLQETNPQILIHPGPVGRRLSCFIYQQLFFHGKAQQKKLIVVTSKPFTSVTLHIA